MTQKRVDSIVEALEEAICSGALANGEKLDEKSLAERFAVSRTPVREALRKLTASGLADQVPNRGVFVCQPGPVELLDMFEVMAELEAVCACFAARRITEEGLEALRAANAACDAAARQGDADRYYSENERFHRTIYAHSGNAFLEQETLRLSRRLRPFRRRQLRLRGRMRQSLGEHEAVLEALRNGDAETAAETIRGHVAIQGEKFHHLISSLQSAAE